MQSSPGVDTSGDLETDETKAVVERMAEAGVKTALISGGEPLLRKDFLEICQALANAGIKSSVVTNGLLLNGRFVEVARALQQRDLMEVTVSLDGGSKETHESLRGPRTFARTVRALGHLARGGVHFDIQAVLSRTTWPATPGLFRLARELSPSVRRLQLAFVSPVGRGERLVDELALDLAAYDEALGLILAHARDLDRTVSIKLPPAVVPPKYLPQICSGSRLRLKFCCDFPLLGILPNGEVTICGSSTEDVALRLGNIRTDRLNAINAQVRLDELRRNHRAAESLAGICGDCVWKYRCMGSCRVWAHQVDGSLDAPYPLCAWIESRGEFPDVYRISKHVARAHQHERSALP